MKPVYIASILTEMDDPLLLLRFNVSLNTSHPKGHETKNGGKKAKGTPHFYRRPLSSLCTKGSHSNYKPHEAHAIIFFKIIHRFRKLIWRKNSYRPNGNLPVHLTQ